MLRHHESRETFERLAAAIEAIDNSLPSLDQPATSTGADPIKAHITDLKDNVTNSIQRIAVAESSLARKHNILITAHNISQANSVSRLTVLAMVFLPLSLAGTILSMQTRLRDLNYILFDLAGIFLIFRILALFLMSNVIRPVTPGYFYQALVEIKNTFIEPFPRAVRLVFLASSLALLVCIILTLPLDNSPKSQYILFKALIICPSIVGVALFLSFLWTLSSFIVSIVQKWLKRRNSSTARST
tara:strand:- start:3702 stop:4433 length:732 start_codon:yes stop_codon:yes gene_type:complete